MIYSEKVGDYRVTIGLTDTGQRYCEIRHVASGVRISRQEFTLAVTVPAALEAAKRFISERDGAAIA